MARGLLSGELCVHGDGTNTRPGADGGEKYLRLGVGGGVGRQQNLCESAPAALAQQTGIFVGNEHKSSRIAGPEQCTQRSSCSFGSCPSQCWDWRALGPCGGMSCTSVQLGATKSPPESSVSEQSPVADSHSSPPQKQLSAIAHIPFIFFTFLLFPTPASPAGG